MIATLPMYDPPWLRQANDDLWTQLAARLQARGVEDVPTRLDRGADLDAAWTSPSLLLGQTCGYPLVTSLRESVQLVATPHYDAEGCDGPYHRAAIIVRRDDPANAIADLRGRSAGVNSYDSNTGMNLFRGTIAEVADGPTFFASVTPTGSHAQSLAAVISGRVDVASIDAVTLALLGDHHPELVEQIRVLGWTAASPSLPLITSLRTSETVVATLSEELEDIASTPELRRTLGSLRINGFSVQSLEIYGKVIAIEKQAIERGYTELR